MITLNRKIIRDLTLIKGQVLTIMIVIGSGVMVLVLLVNSLQSLTHARNDYYASNQFADIYVTLKRAPEQMSQRLRTVPGINRLTTRIQAPVRIRLPEQNAAANGLILSLPNTGQPELNRLHLKQGRLPDPNAKAEVVVNDTFAQAYSLQVGDQFDAILNGRQETVTICGTAISPEFIYLLGPNEFMPDYRRYTILWMSQKALSAAYDMDGAFNSLIATIQPNANIDAVIDALDLHLTPYGSNGAFSKKDLVSHRFLQEELNQLNRMSKILPTIFLGVAMFLLHVLMGRIVKTQRQQIAVLKAFGYYTYQIVIHYMLLTVLIALLGSALGIVLGIWASHSVTLLITTYFQFPAISPYLKPEALIIGSLLATAAAVAGSTLSVLQAARLAPAEAMRPPSPPDFHRSSFENLISSRWINPIHRIILRNAIRYRLKTFLSVLGISLAVALLFMGNYQFGAVNFMIENQFQKIQLMDLTLQFAEPRSSKVLSELQALPGVHFVEPYHPVAIRLINQHRQYLTALQGIPAKPALSKLLDQKFNPITPPSNGIILSRYLGDYLGISPGEVIAIEFLEGSRRSRQVTVTDLVDDQFGVGVWMEQSALNKLLMEGPTYSGAWLLIDSAAETKLTEKLEAMPLVLNISRTAQVEQTVRSYLADTILVFMAILLIMAGSLAFAVVYNNARISFTERNRELATLRAIGFSFFDVVWILAGDTILLTGLAIPLGWLIGTGFARLMVEVFNSELFRIPFVVDRSLYAFAGLGICLSAAISIGFTIHQLKQLTIVTALKSE